MCTYFKTTQWSSAHGLGKFQGVMKYLLCQTGKDPYEKF